MSARLTENGPWVIDWGRRDYAWALVAQRERQRAVIEGDAEDAVVLVEHEPVITRTPRAAASAHVLASPERLAALGIAVHDTDRGGDVTYHGPGQLVAYPILRLTRYGLNLSSYMRLLEQAVIETVGAFGVEAHREDKLTGVWVGGAAWGEPGATPRKLCALGVRIRKNVTMHGLALNVNTDLSHFETIVPCGLADRSVTSLRALLGAACPSMHRVGVELVARLEAALRDASGLPAPERVMGAPPD